MQPNLSPGLFVAVDGPNGVGKTSVVSALPRALGLVDAATLVTREPTETDMGRWIRSAQSSATPHAFASLIAADRYWHVEREIKPMLATGTAVFCDRYIASSLVLQGLDGLDFDLIWKMNFDIIVPDITIILLADPRAIAGRLDSRPNRDRFESRFTPEIEVESFRCTSKTLQEKGFPVSVVELNDLPLEQSIELVAAAIRQTAKMTS